MALPHFYLDRQIISQEEQEFFVLTLNPEDLKHVKVLRLQKGEHIAVVDAAQDYYELEIVSYEGRHPVVKITQRLDAFQSQQQVCLVQGLAKGEKMDAVVRQTAELGISGIVVCQMMRSVVRLKADKIEAKVDRFEAIARSASMQAGRTSIPQISFHRSVALWTDSLSPQDVVLVFWEEAPSTATLRLQFDRYEKDFLSAEHIFIVIGPEGGLHEKEIQLLSQSVARTFFLTLGPTILRTETAGVVSSALVLNELRDRQ